MSKIVTLMQGVTMDRDSFQEKMMMVNDAFMEERYEESLAGGEALSAELQSLPLCEAEMLCWPLYYRIRSLHALSRWAEQTQLMRDEAFMLHAIGPQNSAYAYSLTMEASAQAGELDELPKWAYGCFDGRLMDDDHEALKMAISTSRHLLELFERLELFPTVLEKLAEAAERHHDDQLAHFARQWALKERGELPEDEGH